MTHVFIFNHRNCNIGLLKNFKSFKSAAPSLFTMNFGTKSALLFLIAFLETWDLILCHTPVWLSPAQNQIHLQLSRHKQCQKKSLSFSLSLWRQKRNYSCILWFSFLDCKLNCGLVNVSKRFKSVIVSGITYSTAVASNSKKYSFQKGVFSVKL